MKSNPSQEYKTCYLDERLNIRNSYDNTGPFKYTVIIEHKIHTYDKC